MDDALITGLICAKIINDPNFQVLYDSYIKAAENDDFFRENLLKLMNYLDDI